MTYDRLSVSKFRLFFWEQGTDYWFDVIVDQLFKNLVRNEGEMDQWLCGSSTGFESLGIVTTSTLFQTLEILSRSKQEEEKLCSQNFKLGPAWITSSGQIESEPRALPGFK